jgi:hypothetical protein
MPESKKNMVWLASYPKSGNTWFRVFLNNLFSDSSLPVSINDLSITTISSNRAIIDGYLGLHSSELAAEEIDLLRPQVYKRYSDELEGTAYIKTHEAWTVNRRGDPMFPDEITKGVIYIIRNPLDVAISYSFHNNEPIDDTIAILNDDFAKLCEEEGKLFMQIRQLLRSWSSHVSSWLDDSKLPVHVLRYEDMLEDPLRSFRSAIEFLDLQFREEEIVNAIHNSSFDTLKDMEKRDGFKERGTYTEVFFREGRANAWETGLTLRQVKEIITHHGEIMKRFGYMHKFEPSHAKETRN